MTFELRLVLAVFAIFRLARLAAKDTLTEPLRNIVGRWASGKKAFTFPWMMAELVNCPYCMGVWITFALAPFVVLPNTFSDAFLIVFALTGAQMFLQDRSGME